MVVVGGGGGGSGHTSLAYHHSKKAEVLERCLSVVQVWQTTDGACPVSDMLLSDNHFKVLFQAVCADLALTEVEVANLTQHKKMCM